MTPQEQAFNDWGESVGSFGFDYLEVWNAACTWQREQDAKIIYNREIKYFPYGEYYEDEVRKQCVFELLGVMPE